jgi:quercetin dioxygenase-like cupin family protein
VASASTGRSTYPRTKSAFSSSTPRRLAWLRSLRGAPASIPSASSRQSRQEGRRETKEESDVYVTRNAIAVGGHSGWHTHPGPSLIIVTLGEIMAYDADDPPCTPTRYRAGAGFVDPGDGHVHLLRNESGAPAETVAVQFLPKDATRRIDAPAPGNCPF